MTGRSPDLLDAWRVTCERRGTAVAVVEENGTATTFAEIDAAARAMAREFHADGAGQIVALHLPNGGRWIAAYLGLSMSGRIVLPLDPDLSPNTARALARDQGAAAFVDARGLELLGDARPGPPRAHLIKLTSGSTGSPKALFFGQPEMRADGEQVVAGMGLLPEDRHLAVVPFGHSYGLGNLVLPLILQGASLVCTPGYLPQALLDVVRRHEATVLPLVPPLVRGLAATGESKGLGDSVRLVISAGARLDPAVARRFAGQHGRRVHNFYGASETGGIAFDPDGEATESGRSVGRPLPGVRVAIIDGAVSVSSAAVVRDTPGTGGVATQILADTGELTPDGELVLQGRRDQTIKIGGRRISLPEVEAAVRTLPNVDEVAVVAVDLPGREPRIAALVATAGDLDAIERAAREVMPSWQRPRIWRACLQLPVNARGKVDREAVRQTFSRTTAG